MKNKGFTLVELMIVVAIIGIIAAYAVPNYQESVRKAYRADAQASMMAYAAAIEAQHTRDGSYAGLGSLTFATAVPNNSEVRRYELQLTFNTTSFTMHAISEGPQLKDGNLRLRHTGERRWAKNGVDYNQDW